jgi:hypothetical protein
MAHPHRLLSVGVPHKTKAHAIAKPAKTTRIIKQKQRLEKTVPNSRSQEVSRETARKTPKSVRYDICGVGEVRRFKRKTPQNKALSGVFVFGCRAFAAGILAERAGFEPAVGCYPTHAFQACDLNHSSISPEEDGF